MFTLSLKHLSAPHGFGQKHDWCTTPLIINIYMINRQHFFIFFKVPSAIPVVASVEVFMQPAFQPSSTPVHLQHRFMVRLFCIFVVWSDYPYYILIFNKLIITVLKSLEFSTCDQWLKPWIWKNLECFMPLFIRKFPGTAICFTYKLLLTRILYASVT